MPSSFACLEMLLIMCPLPTWGVSFLTSWWPRYVSLMVNYMNLLLYFLALCFHRHLPLCLGYSSGHLLLAYTSRSATTGTITWIGPGLRWSKMGAPDAKCRSTHSHSCSCAALNFVSWGPHSPYPLPGPVFNILHPFPKNRFFMQTLHLSTHFLHWVAFS